MADELMLFTLQASRAHAESVAGELGIALSAHEEREFEDGEHKARLLVSVRGRDVYVIHSLTGGAQVGDVGGRTAIIVDDLISGGNTLFAEAIRRLHGNGSIVALQDG